MVSVVIRNKNEAEALEMTLRILTDVYIQDIDEIILVDNESTDKSVELARTYNCKILTINNFTYGKAINLGVQHAKNNLVLLLSAHAVPVGQSFFKNSVKALNKEHIAGIRFINSFDNYQRALRNKFQVKDGLSYGLMASCAMVNKQVWQKFRFDEALIASEDKEWSNRVIKSGYVILDLNETFFYHLRRNQKSSLKRFKIETMAHNQLHGLRYSSYFKLILIFLKKVILDVPKMFFGQLIYETKIFIVKLKIKKNQ